MSTTTRKRTWTIATAGLAVLAAGALGVAAGQQTGDEQASATGIGVHGDWTIEVVDEDGSVVERDEFQNSLSTVGETHLLRLLARDITQGFPQVLLQGDDPPCEDEDGEPSTCRLIVDGASGDPSDPEVFDTLVVEHDDSDRVLTISGTATASTDGDIDAVATDMRFCDREVAPEDCAGPSLSGRFTRATDLDYDLAEGQDINVTVDISFTSADG